MDDICSILAGSEYESVCAGPDKNIEDQLKELGIDIRDANGEIKTLSQVLKEISNIFNNCKIDR